MEFIALPQDDIALMEYDDENGETQELTRSEIRLTKNIQNWVKYEIANRKEY